MCRSRCATPDQTEPTGYVDQANNPLMDTWRDSDPVAGTIQSPDVPFDSDSQFSPPLSQTGHVAQYGDLQNYRTVFLQRLANPTLPYDDTLNPYVTVDWSPLDLTVFTGENREGSEQDQDDDNETPGGGWANAEDIDFETRERRRLRQLDALEDEDRGTDPRRNRCGARRTSSMRTFAIRSVT